MELRNINTEQYDLQHAPNGHKERFAIKMMEEQKKRARKRLITWTSVAASLSLLIVFGLSTLNQSKIQEPIIQNTCYNQELEELQFYYTSQENLIINQIKSIGIDSALLDQEVLQLDSMIQDLCKELNTAPDDDRIIEMAVQHYTMKLNTLDHILQQLESIQHQKIRTDETINL